MSVLSSLRVLDFSTLLPGPFASMHLADMGADVLRVEAPGRPDMVRMRPPFDGGVSAGHAYLNRSKRSIALDMKKPNAADVVRRLIHTYDIVLEQFRPGVMDRLGIGYEALSSENPGVIYCALTGYGQNGPMRDRAGHDNNYLSLAGVMSVSGRRGQGPSPQGVQIADIGGGSLCAIAGILAAVIHRNHTGEGQFVDVSMFDGALSWNCQASPAYLVGGIVPGFETQGLNGGTHYDYYRTKDGRYLSVGSLEPKFWMEFCEVIGHPEIIPRLAEPGPEMDSVKVIIRAAIEKQDFAEWRALFAKADCCVEPVLNIDEAVAHPQTAARSMVVDVPKPDGTMQKQIGSPFKFSKAQPRFKHIGAKLGEHTAQVLKEAGFAESEITGLREQGVFGDVLDKA